MIHITRVYIECNRCENARFVAPKVRKVQICYANPNRLDCLCQNCARSAHSDNRQSCSFYVLIITDILVLVVFCRWSSNSGGACVCCCDQRYLLGPDSAPAERRQITDTAPHRHSAHCLWRHQRHCRHVTRLEDQVLYQIVRSRQARFYVGAGPPNLGLAPPQIFAYRLTAITQHTQC